MRFLYILIILIFNYNAFSQEFSFFNADFSATSLSLGADAAFTLSRPTHGSTSGSDTFIIGQAAAGTNKDGGDLKLKLAAGTGSHSQSGSA